MTTETIVPLDPLPTKDVTPSAAKLTANTMCLVVRSGTFGNSKKASLAGAVLSGDDPTREPDKKLLSLSKTLLVSPELYAVSKFDAETGRMLRQIGFDSMFKSGVHLISVAQVLSTEKEMSARAEARLPLVSAAVATYEQRAMETSERLGVAYSPMDYPPVQEFASKFYFEWQWVAWDTPTRLKAISAEMFEYERAKAQSQLASVAQECQQAMRAGLLKLVDHLAERITCDEDGKVKRFKAATVENLNDFLATFELRNVTDDAALAEVVQRARAVMEGVDPTTIKKDDLTRRRIQEELAKLKGALEPMVVDVRTRVIEFED